MTCWLLMSHDRRMSDDSESWSYGDTPAIYLCANEPTRFIFEAIECEFERDEIYTGMVDHAVHTVADIGEPDLSWDEMRQLGKDILLLWREPRNDARIVPPWCWGTAQFLEELRETLDGRWEDIDPVAVGGWAAMYAVSKMVKDYEASL